MNNTTLFVIVLLLLGVALFAWLRRKSANGPAVNQWDVDEPDIPKPVIQAPLVQPPAPQKPAPQKAAPQPQVTTPPPEFQPSGNEPDTDQRVLDQLREAGSDLSKPHQMEFLLYFPTEEAARKAANKIKAEGFSVDVKRAPQGPMWLCLAMKRMAPKRAEIAAIGRKFTAVAQEFNGDYDGWETSLEK
jgi:hypothetical protein